jgi:hypothetical protein
MRIGLAARRQHPHGRCTRRGDESTWGWAPPPCETEGESSARPLSVPVEVRLSMQPFTLLQRSSALRQIPAAGSTLLAYIFKAALKSLLARSASHSRPSLAFFRLTGLDHCESPVTNFLS